MNDKILEKYIQAGKVASAVREEAKSWAKPGMRLLELAERIESSIRDKGAEPAFPVNLSLNDVAAHFTPAGDDKTVIGHDDILKIDIGCHIDGYIGDTAVTIAFDDNFDYLRNACESSLAEAVEMCKPGTLISEIAAKIEKTMKYFNANPISNLTGHALERFDLHAEPSIPNISFGSTVKLYEGQVIAIEPFSTPGRGMVKDSEQVFIFSVINPKPVRNQESRRILNWASQFHGMPFALRWVEKELGISGFKLNFAIKELVDSGVLHQYPVLKEVTGSNVGQAEHTVIVGEQPIVTTK